MELVAARPGTLTDKPFHYCPGCTHGIIHRLVAEVLEELDLRGKAIGIASVGCSVFAYDYFRCDMQQAAHGRAPAVATGIKRTQPESFVFTYQGDGDLGSIGIGETVHAANRGENISIIFVNNAVYGMTGGQMAPTTLLGQRSTTSPGGREAKAHGYPLPVAEMLATLPGVAYLARTKVTSPAGIHTTKRAIKLAFRAQIAERGFSLVEILSTCPTNWHLDPIAALEFVDKEMAQVYPLKVFRTFE
ncbi:MAG: 2-oxoglutarate oxidoreductase [Firmicutes bacterium]|nr:2-oxoglutarate oxidoreductase [Bacillota bacterium]